MKNALETKLQTASDGTEDSTKLNIPESAAFFVCDRASDPDGGPVSYQVQPLVSNQDNDGWDEDGEIIGVTVETLDYDISSKTRGLNITLELDASSLSFQVRSVNTNGGVSNWAMLYYAYKRNPTILNVGSAEGFTPECCISAEAANGSGASCTPLTSSP